MMTHGAMLWGAALYNNGAYPLKNPHFGEAYDVNGKPERSAHISLHPPPKETRDEGRFALPRSRCPAGSTSRTRQPAPRLRTRRRASAREIGNPNTDAEAGRTARPEAFGSRPRHQACAPTPSSSACRRHDCSIPCSPSPAPTISPATTAPAAAPPATCSTPMTATPDPRRPRPQPSATPAAAPAPTLPSARSKAATRSSTFSRSMIPSSQCMTCHMHPGTNMETTFYGFTWWDNEADGATRCIRRRQHDPSLQEQLHDTLPPAIPEGSVARGLLERPKVSGEESARQQFNANIKDTQFADFHSHGWVFRAVYKRDRHGNLLDKDGQPDSARDRPNNRREPSSKAVHLADIHLEKGDALRRLPFLAGRLTAMASCMARHATPVEIGCADCHGTIYPRERG